MIAQGDERERKRGVIQKGLKPPPPPPPNSLHPSLLRGKERRRQQLPLVFLASRDHSFTLPCPSASIFIVYLLNEGGGAAPA